MSRSRRRLSVVATGAAAAGGDGGGASDSSVKRGIGVDGQGGARRRRLSQVALPVPGDAAVPFGVDAVGPTGGKRLAGLPILYGAYSRPGNDPMKNAKENQDAMLVVEQFGGREEQLLVAVMDGHGPSGAGASTFVREVLPSAVDWKALADDPFVALNAACVSTNQRLSTSAVDVYVSGSTAIIAFLRGPRVYVANVGDSRAVLARTAADGALRALDLSNDQKPDRPDEQARIVAAGGRVFEWGVPRVWLKDVDMPGLAMARSFGDLAAESVGVFAEPELSQVTLKPTDKALLLASDGVWEFISSQEAVDIVAPFIKSGDPQAAADALVAESLRRWLQEEDVVDDITCVVMFLDFPAE